MTKPTPILLAGSGAVEIRGARQNNLKGIDLDLPLGKLNVISGPSGSGKSSLAFDTIYAEGQRRYVETFSPYTRQFLERMDKPKVDEIRGIPPAIAIEQSNSVKTSRSTVGTMTEINDYLKVLMPRIVHASCPTCAREIRPETPKSIVTQVLSQLAGETVLVSFAVPVPPKTKPGDFLDFLKQQGYLRAWIDNSIHRTDTKTTLKRLPALVHVIQDRLLVSEENRSRLTEAIETALRFGKGKVAFIQPSSFPSEGSQKGLKGLERREGEQIPECASPSIHYPQSTIHTSPSPIHPFSTGWHCAYCDVEITPPSPGLFSFNNPLGACPACRGFGRTIGIDLDRAIPDRALSIARGAVKPFQTESGRECQRDLMRHAARRDLDVRAPFEELSKQDQDFVLHGEDPNATAQDLWDNDRWYGVRGFFDWLESKSYKMHVRVLLSRYRSYTLCSTCHGARLQPAALNFRVNGKTLPELAALPVSTLCEQVRQWHAELSADPTTEMLRAEVEARLRYLVEVGVGYLSLDRQTRTLSGGEVERVNLTTCLGASLVNTLFVLDEPTVGLHPRDVGRLVRVMKNLRDKGNTLLVVEHDEAVMRAADNLIELGPGRGEAGGQLVFNGPIDALCARSRSLTADYLTGRKSIPVPPKRRTPKTWLRIEGASQHNLRNIDVDIPLGVFACVTGVSGSGKSTLVHDVLYQNMLRQKGGPSSEETAGACRRITGARHIDEVVLVDQSPLSRTPRSNPAVYLGVFEQVREAFALLPDARTQGLTAGAFSFNSGPGRCPRCSGNGFEKIEMQFLSDVFVRCPECDGKRYQPHILKLHLDGHSIHDVLELTVNEAILFFKKLGQERISGPLEILQEVGLGYLRLGQPLNVLSGGESQRLKLVGHLTGRTGSRSLLILDEPTTGLHFDDVALLLKVFNRLVEQGNSLLVIEHNLEVIKCADHLIDLGPEGGAEGGLVIATGTPEEITAVKESHTGIFLRGTLRIPHTKARRHEEERTTIYNSPFTSPSSDPSTIHDPLSTSPLLRVAEQPPSFIALPNSISIRGAREHNLKNISLDIPRDQMVVITGLSGSGKSTLAFDILFAEGQRRFLDSMSPYARQFVEQLEKPDVDVINGLPPTVAIEQRVTRGGGKSTVATVTEVYHFLRLLFAKTGTQFCPKCDLPVEKQSVAAMVKRAAAMARRGRIRVLAPLIKARKGFHTDVAQWALKQGFKTLLVDGRFVATENFKKLERFQEHTIDVLVESVGTGRSSTEALIRRALEIGRGTVRILDSKNHFAVLSTEMSCPGCGQSFEELDPRLFSFNSPHGWCERCRGFGEIWNVAEKLRTESVLEAELDEERQHEWLEEGEALVCPACAGTRLNGIARNVRVQNMTIGEFTLLSAEQALVRAGKLKFKAAHRVIATDILAEIRQRLLFMSKVGLDYLQLSRPAMTLSGGESQRIRLAAQLGSNLRGVLYVLDEPTIGLHSRDNQALLDTLETLKEKGNSLVIVEHDDDTMRRADIIVDLGPKAGAHGGEVVAVGTLSEIRKNPVSATGLSLREPMRHPSRGTRRPLAEVTNWLEVSGANANNLKNVDIRFPIGRFTVITGISGSGKSTLMGKVLLPAVKAKLDGRRSAKPDTSKGAGHHVTTASLQGAEFLETVYEVDQSPIGKTSRSTPATYVGFFDEIRKQFATLPVSRMRGYTASRFSFNTQGGRCETCAGQGVIKIEMNFLPTSYIPCSDCGGKRYNPSTLEVPFNGRSIGDVLDMTIEEAAGFFKSNPAVHRPLALLVETGLGYLKLGQPSPTLSGGEAQRLKLVTELTRGVGRAQTSLLRKQRIPKSTLYLLEEPTIGLHMADVAELLKVLHRLVDDGNTVIVIEHNLSLIADADYIVDLGPEAGESGGRIVATGTPEQVAKSKPSRTAPFLRKTLSTQSR